MEMLDWGAWLSWWKPAVEILILWLVIYYALRFFEGTRASQVVRGIIVLAIAFLVFQRLNFVVIDWLFTKLFGFSVLALLVVFQPEIRQGLARLGQRHLFDNADREAQEPDTVLREILTATETFCKNKVGGLIVIAQHDPLSEYVKSGVPIDGRVTSELLETIFTPNSLLHDGGVIVQNGRIVAAGCLFPLSQKPDLSRVFGTRHRAGLGLSEETDAVVVVVSEERQDMALIHRGRMFKELSKEDMFSKIKEIMKTHA